MPNYAADNSDSLKDKRSYVSGQFHLELDGTDVGVLGAVEGGNFKAEPIGEQVGSEGLVTRYPGRQKFEDISFTLGSSMSPKIWAIMADHLAGKPRRLNGSIVTRDFDHRERVTRAFQDALIAEIGFPGVDANSKGPASLTVKITPEQMAFSAGSKKKPTDGAGSNLVPQKKLLLSNYRFRLDALKSDDTCKHIVKIDPFSVKHNVIDNPFGGMLYSNKEAGRLEFPTLSLQIVETYAQPWIDWWQKFVGQGNHTSDNETTGSLVYLDSALKTELLTINFTGVGISGITFDKHEAGAEAIRYIKVDLYCEALTLVV